MKYTHYVALSMTLLTSMSPCSSVAASTTCEELITACFASAPEERDACIQTASAASACETSSLHNLVAKRAQFSVIKQLPQEQGPAFLGPQIVDRRCLAQFDTTWSAALVNGSVSRDAVSSLSAALDECARSETPAIPHL